MHFLPEIAHMEVYEKQRINVPSFFLVHKVMLSLFAIQNFGNRIKDTSQLSPCNIFFERAVANEGTLLQCVQGMCAVRDMQCRFK